MTEPLTPAFQLDRRKLLQLATSTAAAATLAPAAYGQARTPVQAIGFDGFVVFDPRPIAVLTEQLYPGKGDALGALWRTRQFDLGRRGGID